MTPTQRKAMQDAILAIHAVSNLSKGWEVESTDAIIALRNALAEPALMQEPVAWRFRKNGHWAFRNDNVNGLVCEPLFAMQVPESVYKSALDEWLDKTEWVQKTAHTHELGMHRADVLRRRIEAKVRQKAG